MNKLIEYAIRFRNWIVTLLGSLLLILPDVIAALGSPEVLAVIPSEYHRWVAIGILVLNLAMRWRPAVIATDPEAQVSRLRKKGYEFTGDQL